MAREAGIRVDGARQLRSTLRRAGDDLSDLKDIHAEVGRIVEPVARAGAPVVSGRLAATVRSSGTKTQTVVRAGYASVPYAGPIHWGWPARRIRPRPFIADAAKKTEPRWVLAFKTGVDRILNKIKGA